MKTVGIVAEYNPFHNGHLHQMEWLKKEKHVDTICIVMSGDFVQRGAPAWIDKYTRAQMALEAGADFVFQLPVRYSLSSAESFALGGIAALDALDLDAFCFGSETGNLSKLMDVEHLISHLDTQAEFQEQIQKLIRKGMSYPAARQAAYLPYIQKETDVTKEELSSANNILGFEYLQAMRLLDSSMTPLTLSRADHGYHDPHFHGHQASASAIREKCLTLADLDLCRNVLPEYTIRLLKEHPQFPITTEDFSLLLFYALSLEPSTQNMIKYGDINEDLANHIWKLLPDFESATDFLTRLKTKNYTYTRLSRCLFHILLHLEQLPSAETQVADPLTSPVPYLRLLGIRKSKSNLLRMVTKAPIITKVADYEETLRSFYLDCEDYSDEEKQSLLTHAKDCFHEDLFAANLYRQVTAKKFHCRYPDEFHHGIVLYQ